MHKIDLNFYIIFTLLQTLKVFKFELKQFFINRLKF